ncbi:DUF4191 domain-containing protein [Xylanimonas protaetiae]|uniref:DUF4191 domain-containing protein n=1 Tax=Xylanimonas protaetiae TaxID=2509457 RepID=A0A4P6F5V3_9MICO|nr:DUF4191 domain-containing protein [Xylanimonas protaetiae]QAY71340.1 DUF4191 domain-containing protein [Xylanimonas protaetiae]
MARSNASADATKAKKPKKQRWYHQVWQAYTMTRQQDPSVTWVLLGIFVGVLLVGLAIGLATDAPVYATIVAVPFAALATMYMLTRRAERAAYSRIKGQPGAARAALGTVRGGWTFEDEPVAVSARTQDFVFRGVGRPGVVLVSEGPGTRVTRLLEDERRRTARVLPNVPIHLIQMGDDAGQVELMKLGRAVSKLKPSLTRPEVAEVSKRLRALGGQKLPVPKGIDPFKTRPDRKGMRGR